MEELAQRLAARLGRADAWKQLVPILQGSGSGAIDVALDASGNTPALKVLGYISEEDAAMMAEPGNFRIHVGSNPTREKPVPIYATLAALRSGVEGGGGA